MMQDRQLNHRNAGTDASETEYKNISFPPPPFPRAKTKAVRNDDETIAVDVKLR